MRSVLFVFTLCLLALACTRTASPDGGDNELRGAWRLVQHATAVDGDSVMYRNPQPALFIFDENYYSMMLVPGEEPRALFAASATATDSEKITAYDSFIANSGRYESMGDELTTHPLVSKHPNFMGLDSQVFSIRLLGDTLWLEVTGGFLAGTDAYRLERMR